MRTGKKILWIVVVAVLVASGTIWLSGVKKADGAKTADPNEQNRQPAGAGTLRQEPKDTSAADEKTIQADVVACVTRNLPDVASSEPEVSRLALARIANTGREGAIILATLLESRNASMRQSAERALKLLRHGGYDIVRVLSGMCTDNTLPASVSIKALKIITGPDEEARLAKETSDEVKQLVPRVEKLETKTARPDAEDRMVKKPAAAKPTAPAKMSAEELAEKKAPLEDKIGYLQKKMYEADSYRASMQRLLDDNPRDDPNLRAFWRMRAKERSEMAQNFKRQITEAQTELTKLH